MALLEVENLSTHFFLRRGTIKAVDHVSFSIEAGETLGLVGESGSGKSMVASSLLRLIAQPGRIVGGAIRFEGVNLLSLDEKQMRSYRGRRMSMILQDPLSSLNPVLTIEDQVGEGIAIHDKLSGAALRDRVIEVLKLVGIPAAEKRLRDYPHHFSGGMRQRVVGAIALACRPQFLIADEPTTSLDVTIQLQYLNLLREIQQRDGLAMLFVTHDFGVVSKMCDRVAVMYAGMIVETASVREIFNNPCHPYTKALIESVPEVDEKVDRLSSIQGQPPSPLARPKGCPFVTRCPVAMPRCAGEMPPETKISEQQQVRCWHYV
ncbi:MAG TPA: ABC transporter ATP-binding protein [Devosia sp.]|nr:ABC transporter ATP-binding protein [Devosia sp.]